MPSFTEEFIVHVVHLAYFRRGHRFNVLFQRVYCLLSYTINTFKRVYGHSDPRVHTPTSYESHN